MYDKLIQSRSENTEFLPLTIREIIFSPLSHRSENSNVIYSHIENRLITINLSTFRKITCTISDKLISLGLKNGDTILLASFSCSNELANALIFAAATCTGIRVFVPMFPEPAEFDNWKKQTDFSCIIMPYRETFQLKGHEREKEVIYALQKSCIENNIPFLDTQEDLSVFELLLQKINNPYQSDQAKIPQTTITPQTEAVIFTTSGTSGISKLLVYTHQDLANCCQAWQQAGLFDKNLVGNAGFSPLFTHTIGIRTFINSIWSGNPFCILVTDWLLYKPEVARYLLMNMKPGHIIAGPAFYNTLLELFRLYPELKTGMNDSLQAAISIGAPYDEVTAAKFRSATGISMMNGFGTTETLMVTLNRNNNHETVDPKALGELLPGVSIGLKKTEEESIYELSIHSAFQATRTLGEQQPDFFDTGDLVWYDEKKGNLFFRSRKSSDFIKDEYGVKIPLCAMKQNYKSLYKTANWIEWIPLVNIPGLAAMIFLPATQNNNQQKEIASLIKNTNEELKRTIEPFEYAHRHIERFTLIHDELPLTRKGTVSKDQIYKRYDCLIAELRNPFVFNNTIETTEPGDKSPLYKFSDPYMSELLEALKLDKIYVKGEGDYLFYQDGNVLQRATDLVGGFGGNLFGHNHPKIKDVIIRFLETGAPALNNQGSQYNYPASLARELNRLFSKSTGKYFKVQFANSGAEALEIALHHAYWEWRQKIEKIRDEQYQLYGAVAGLPVAGVWDKNMQLLQEASPCLLVANDCFHGYSSGARSLLNNKKQRYLFSGLLKPVSLHISDKEPNWKELIEKYINENTIELQLFKTQNGVYTCESVSFTTIIGSVIEPVRGEGGIHNADPAFIDFLAGQDFPLISDEIQCGLGRTGSFPEYKQASYYLLGKSLGGGYEKIAAVLIDDQRFKPTFTKYYNSTFANGELAAYTALASLQLIIDENLIEMARNKGSLFLSMLQEAADQFPDIIESVDGKGLMIGIHFNPDMGKDNNFLRILIENEVSGYLFAGWLLNKHHIRVLPSLSKPNSLRLEPSFYLPESEMQTFCNALVELCNLCRQKSIYELCKFLMNDDPYPDKAQPIFKGLFPQQIEQPADNAVKVGFIGNFTLPHRELQIIEPDFQKASDTGLRILFNRLQILFEGKPIKIISRNLMQGKVHFTFYVLPFDTSQLEIVSRWGKKRFYIAKVQEAVDTLTREGAVCLSLGAHTSIITGNGLNLAEHESCKILTGNTLTVASCIYYLNQYLKNSSTGAHKPRTIAVVGASGNIGSGLVECLADPMYNKYEIILAGNNEKRLEKLKDKMPARNSSIKCTNDLFELKRADIIICCANTNDHIIYPHHVQPDNQVFIIDISVPSAVADEVKLLKNVIFCKDASSVFLHDNPYMLFSTHTPEGKTFCCAGESILYGMNHLQIPMKGHINKEAVSKLVQLAMSEKFFNLK